MKQKQKFSLASVSKKKTQVTFGIKSLIQSFKKH